MTEPKVSVIIPTKNGGKHIEKCLSGIFTQETRFDYEVIVIDSGSSDDTVQIVNRFPVRLVEIKPREFGHGKTRNLGASLAVGKYLVFTVQDANAANAHYLDGLVLALEENDRVAGAYSRWLPKPGCNPLESRLIAETFSPIRETRNLDGVDKEDYLSYMSRFILFSDVSSCIRKKVWREIPFDETLSFGEDQQWAKKVLEAGYSVVYEPSSSVYHSHNDSPVRIFRSMFDAGASFSQITGETSSVLSVLYSIISAIFSDWWLIVGKRDMTNVKWMGYSVAANAARGSGRWLGTHQRRVPKSLKRRISLVPQIYLPAENRSR